MIGLNHRQDKQLEQFLVLMEDQGIILQWRTGSHPCILPFHDETGYQVAEASCVLLEVKVCELQNITSHGTTTKLLKDYFKPILKLF